MFQLKILHCRFENVIDENTGTDLGCVDINECSDGSANCDVNAICVNEIGTFNCQCKPGFTGNGRTCEGNHFNLWIWFLIILQLRTIW